MICVVYLKELLKKCLFPPSTQPLQATDLDVHLLVAPREEACPAQDMVVPVGHLGETSEEKVRRSLPSTFTVKIINRRILSNVGIIVSICFACSLSHALINLGNIRLIIRREIWIWYVSCTLSIVGSK